MFLSLQVLCNMAIKKWTRSLSKAKIPFSRLDDQDLRKLLEKEVAYSFLLEVQCKKYFLSCSPDFLSWETCFWQTVQNNTPSLAEKD